MTDIGLQFSACFHLDGLWKCRHSIEWNFKTWREAEAEAEVEAEAETEVEAGAETDVEGGAKVKIVIQSFSTSER